MRSPISKFPLLFIVLIQGLCLYVGPAIHAQDGTDGHVNEFFPNEGVDSEDSGAPWNENIVASHYGGGQSSCWGGYGNRIYPNADLFCALPANQDNLDYLGGVLGCRESRCGPAQPTLDELLAENPTGFPDSAGNFEFWPGEDTAIGDRYNWVVEGSEGDGFFRIIEIKVSGTDGPIFEAYIGDVGPWCNDDPYWEDFSRPNAEDGIDARGRRTNRAGIDVSYALAQALGFSGMEEVDWRWKTIDGAYVVRRQSTEWRW